MKIIEKIRKKAENNSDFEGVTITFLGDSVTQGCFEIYKKENNTIETVFDKKNAYHRYIADLFSLLFPTVPINIINAGISGDTAEKGAERLERDVLRHQPDLVVVSYGLNDATEEKSVKFFKNALKEIFEKLSDQKMEVIFLTPNMMNTKISVYLQDDDMRKIAENKARIQSNGCMDRYMQAAREVCNIYGIPVCDCYTIWKKLNQNGVDTTELLANKINHPIREMNYLFAYELVRTMFQ